MYNVKFYTTGYVSAVIKKDSTAWAWGSYSGLSSGFSNIPMQVLSNVKFADAGISHVAFVKYDGTVWAAGANDKGNLGNGTISPASTPITTPVQMTGIHNAVRVAVAGFIYINAATIILLADSTVKVTGGGTWFQTTNSTIPVSLPGLSGIVDIKAGTYGAYALKSDGSVYSFGRPHSQVPYPILGLGDPVFNFTTPTKITFPSGAGSIVSLSANNDGYTCLALDTNHHVYGWGANGRGELGDGTYIDKSTPVLLATDVIDIFAGETFSYILKDDNTLWATGSSAHGGNIWMNQYDSTRNIFTQIDPTIAPMNLCAPKMWVVLPIKLSSFTCITDNNNAVLNWQSAEETNASKYIVEYSNDGSNFKSIATVLAKGSNSKYNYIHQQVSGTAFYRLKMIDKDGSFIYSEIRVIKFNSKAGITIAPNPANDAIHLFTKNNIAIKSIQLIGYDGRIVSSINTYNSGEQINITSLSNGAYIVKVMYNNNDLEFARFIKK